MRGRFVQRWRLGVCAIDGWASLRFNACVLHIAGTGERTLVGVISDTHGLLRPSAVAALRDCAVILHAGDIGRPEVLASLRSIAPVIAVRGNVDLAWATALPDLAELVVAGRRVLVLHDLKTLRSDPHIEGYAVVVSGHSHRPNIARHGAVLYVNPGSAGPRRFRLPIALARIELSPDAVEAQIVELAE